MRGGLAGWGEGAQTLNQAQRAAGLLTLRVLNHPEALCLLHCFGFTRATSSKNLQKHGRRAVCFWAWRECCLPFRERGALQGKALAWSRAGEAENRQRAVWSAE